MPTRDEGSLVRAESPSWVPQQGLERLPRLIGGRSQGFDDRLGLFSREDGVADHHMVRLGNEIRVGGGFLESLTVGVEDGRRGLRRQGKPFEKHRAETEGQVDRLEQVFAIIDKKPQGKTCAAIVGITDEGAEIMKEYKGSPALDAGLLAAAQAVEHYEISRYGTMRTWAEELGLDDAASLLQETLEEEEATDDALTEIAKTAVNQEAEAA